MLTGEPKTYTVSATNNEVGGFGAPKVASPFSLNGDSWGAWELTARYSDTDLNWHAAVRRRRRPHQAGINGGDERIVALGVNWYLNNNVKLQLNDLITNVDRYSVAAARSSRTAASQDFNTVGHPPAVHELTSTAFNQLVRTQREEENMRSIIESCARRAGRPCRRSRWRSALAGDISGAGATFPYPIYAKWAGAYQGVSGVGLNYQSIGSGGGIAQIKAKTVTFGASDMPLQGSGPERGGPRPVPDRHRRRSAGRTTSRASRRASSCWTARRLPTSISGKIARWNDPAIKKLNPGVNLPDQAIAVVHRSDGSGTTFVFATYLSRVSAEWKSNVGAATSVDWPTGIGAKGNEGVAGNVAQTTGSIGYVEYAYAKQNHLKYARMVNKDGKTVEPTLEAFRRAAANADWNAAAHEQLLHHPRRPAGRRLLADHGDDLHPDVQAARPIRQRRPTALKFFKWAYANGDRHGAEPRLRAAARERRAGDRGQLEADPGFGHVESARVEVSLWIIRFVMGGLEPPIPPACGSTATN